MSLINQVRLGLVGGGELGNRPDLAAPACSSGRVTFGSEAEAVMVRDALAVDPEVSGGGRQGRLGSAEALSSRVQLAIRHACGCFAI